MTRLTFLLLPLALVLCACAPMPAQEEAAPPSAPDEESAREPSEAVAEPTREPDPAPPQAPPEPPAAEAEPEPSEPAEPQARAAPEEPDRPAAEAGTAPSEEPTAVAEEPAERAPAAEAEPVSKTTGISGRITLSGGDADPQDAVIYFVPETPPADSHASLADGAREIVTRDKTLSPTVMVVGRGTEIHFPNRDPILHNLFSVSPANDFDLGVYGPGEAPSVSFGQTGVVNIYCNVHHDMHAHVLVVDTPWRTRAAADGSFRLEGLPPGPGQLHVWHRQSEPWSRALELPADAPIEISLAVTKPRLPPHRDKTGQPYNRRDRDPYR